jgi:hypothetical protein
MIREVDAQKRERCRSGRFSPRQHETFSGKLSHVRFTHFAPIWVRRKFQKHNVDTSRLKNGGFINTFAKAGWPILGQLAFEIKDLREI